MSLEVTSAVATIADFVANGVVTAAARERAATAFKDTCGVMLAGAVEPAARMMQSMAEDEGAGKCLVIGTHLRTSPGFAALANGVAAHSLDYDDMCFVSLAHPSCALVPVILAAGEIVQANGPAILDAYIVGFELECRLGNVMNPRHYHQRGWHCTSSIGTVGAAAAAARVLGLDAQAVQHALGIAASSASGLKENLGTMVKPLHAGMAARNGLMAAHLAQRGFTSSPQALDGPQGYLAAMDSEHATLDIAAADLGIRWEILDTGVTVKLYPSCAATHPPLDARGSSPGDRCGSGFNDTATADSSQPDDGTRGEVQHAVLCRSGCCVFASRDRHVRRRPHREPRRAKPDAKSHAACERGLRSGGAAVARTSHRAAARRTCVFAGGRRRARLSGSTHR